MYRLLITLLLLPLIHACASAEGTLGVGTQIEYGQSKDDSQLAYVWASYSENPFHCRNCSKFFEDVGIEILPNKNQTHFAVFTDVSRPHYDYSRVGNGWYYDNYDTYEEAFAVVERARQQKQAEIAAKRAAEEAKRAEERRLAEARAARQREQEAAERREREEQKRLRIARQKEAAEKRRKALLAIKPISCEQLVAAVNANEARARRDYSQGDIRVQGLVTDVNVTKEPTCCNYFTGGLVMAEVAVVTMEERTDRFNGCSARMKSFDEAVALNKGDRFDFLCDNWDETFGNITFEGCRLFKNAVK
jgi:hypothetical protein